jgi:hypothetical protein
MHAVRLLPAEDGSARHLAEKWLGKSAQRVSYCHFLDTLNAELLLYKNVDEILDNYAAQKQHEDRALLTGHPCWTFRFIPTSCS